MTSAAVLHAPVGAGLAAEAVPCQQFGRGCVSRSAVGDEDEAGEGAVPVVVHSA